MKLVDVHVHLESERFKDDLDSVIKRFKKAGVPFITTSVNFAGEPFAVKISDIDHKIIDAVDIVIGVGKLDGRPSTLVIDGKEIKR